MQILSTVDYSEVHAHLKRMGTGVSMNWIDDHWKRDEGKHFRVRLDDGDTDRIYLWFEARRHTSGTAKLTGHRAGCYLASTRIIDPERRLSKLAGTD